MPRSGVLPGPQLSGSLHSTQDNHCVKHKQQKTKKPPEDGFMDRWTRLRGYRGFQHEIHQPASEIPRDWRCDAQRENDFTYRHAPSFTDPKRPVLPPRKRQHPDLLPGWDSGG